MTQANAIELQKKLLKEKEEHIKAQQLTLDQLKASVNMSIDAGKVKRCVASPRRERGAGGLTSLHYSVQFEEQLLEAERNVSELENDIVSLKEELADSKQKVCVQS